MFRDYYSILGISRNSNIEEIRSAYRSLSKKWHPDRNQGMDTSKIMIDINEAYAILKDSAAKTSYDAVYDKYTAYQQELKKRQQVDIYRQQTQQNTYQNSQRERTRQQDIHFETGDEELDKKMRDSRKQAEDLVSNFMKSLKEDSKIAAKGAAENCLVYFVVMIIINIVVAFVIAISR